MEYAALTFWLVVIVFTALGVHRVWCSLIEPKIVNVALLPGTLVAQIGYVLGMLITGGTINNTTLITNDETAEPQTGNDDTTRIPFVGAVIVGLLPILGCAIAIYAVSQYLGSDILARMWLAAGSLPDLPTELSKTFNLMHGMLDLVEDLVKVIMASNLRDWHNLLFVYLVICLTVRMAPLTGNIRGAVGALAVLGVLLFIVGQVASSSADLLSVMKPLITFSVAVLITLLIISLLIKGTISLIRIFANKR
jgi:hypothetical protein